MNELTIAAVLAVRAACVTLILAIDALLAEVRKPEPEDDEQGNCLHREEHLTAAPAMGLSGRKQCGRCNEFVGV